MEFYPPLTATVHISVFDFFTVADGNAYNFLHASLFVHLSWLFLCKSEFLYKMLSQDYTEVTYSRSYVKTCFTSFVNLINFYW